MEYLGDNGGGLVGLLGIEDPGGGRPFGSPRSGRRKLKKAPPPGVQNKCDSSSDEEENHVDSLASLPPQPEQGKFIDRRAAMERVPSFFSVVRESTSKDPPPPASPAARLDDSRAVAAPGLQRMGSKRRLSFDANEQDDLQGGDDDDATRGLPRMSSKRRLLGNDDEEETSSDEDGHAMGAQRNSHFPESYPPQDRRRGPPYPGEYHQYPHARGPGPAGYGRQPPANQYPHEEQRYSRRPGPPPMQTSRYPREPAPRGHHQHTQEFRHDPRRRGPSPYEPSYGPPRDLYHPAPPSRDRNGGGPPRIIHPRPYYQPPPPSSSSTSMIAPYHHHHHPSYPQPRDRRGSGSGDEGEYSVVTRSSREEDLPYDLESIKSFEEEEEELLVSTMMSHSMRLQERGGPSSSEPPPPRYRGESPGGHHSPQQQQQRGGPPPPPRRSGDPAGDRLVRREDSVQWVHHDSPVGPAVSVYPKGYDHGRGRQSSEPIIHYHESSASPGPQDDYPTTGPPQQQQQRSRSTSFSGPDGYRNNDPQGTSSSTKQYQRRSSLQGSATIQRPGRRRPAAMVEISPGVQVKLRGASETKECVRRDFFVPCQCCSCDLDMFCIQDADYVLCPQCRVVNPLDTHNNNDSKDSKQPTGPGGGLGLGFTMTDLAQMQQEAMAHGNNHQ